MAATSRSACNSPCPSASFTATRKRKHSKFVSFFFSLTIACCLLSSPISWTSSSSVFCAASPIRKSAAQLHQKPSIAQQVHHVQFADESVHNTFVLMKKSMQKRKKAQQAQTPSQARTPEAQNLSKKQLKKRQLKDALDSGTETAQYVNQAQTQSTATAAASKRSRAQLISAYETIVFSESQIPVFLSQDQHRRRRSKISSQKSVTAPATVKENKSETQVSGSDKLPSDSSQINVALFKRGNSNAMDKDNTQSPSINDNDVVGSIRDKNSPVKHPSSAKSEVQDDEYHSALEKSSSDLAGKSYLARHSPDYDDQDYAHLFQSCALKHATLLVVFLAMLLIAYRSYSRKQRQAALLSLPQFEHVSESKLKDPRRASESSRGGDDMTSFVGYNIQ